MKVLVVWVLTAVAAVSTVAAVTDYDKLRDTVRDLTVDSSTVRSVSGVLIENGLITIGLEEGTIAYLKSVQGKRIGMVFKGTGVVSFQPNLVTEQTNLERFTDAASFNAEFTDATFLCLDDKLTSLFNDLPLGGSAEGLAKIASKHWGSLVMSSPEDELDEAVARTMLNHTSSRVFFSRLEKKDLLDVYAMVNPFEQEPYRLAISKAPKVSVPHLTMVSQCPDPETSGLSTDDGVDPGDIIRNIQHTATIDIERSLDLTGVDRIDMEVISDSVMWFDLGLYPTLIIDSIRLAGYPTLEFHRAKEGFFAWVHLPKTLHRGDKLSIQVYYHGDVIERVEDYPILQTSVLWYPATSWRHLTFFDVTFTYPETMTLASVGTRSVFETKDARTRARWVTGRPVRNFSFHIGFFKRKDFPAENGAPRGAVLYRTPQQADVVVHDVRQSLMLFTKMFGTLPVDSLVATELPGYHGEAFPGLLHLSWMTFYTSDDADFFAEQFISHEVAHQWWGIGVDFDSYRDQWLSEGFAMYSCLMYSQLASTDKNKFFKLLDKYRKEICSFGKRTLGKDLPPPAIALGRRVNDGAFQQGAYNTFVYYKGAWVLHMLRNIMLNLNTMNEDAFMTVMKQFYTTHKGKRASTEDFRKTILDVTGVDLQWFFDQWVYGNKIPSYTYAWKKTKQPDGTWKVTLRVKQTGVPESFQMYVPVKVVNSDETYSRYRLVVRGAEMTVDLPPSALEPDELVFNDLSSVLCEVDDEAFE